jgi:hypothetical protein
MEENLNISYIKNMPQHNFNTTINVAIDSNANIKNILDITTYLFDQRVECGSGKAIISGKIGIKVLYIDTDNMTNTLVDSTNFSETYLDNSITSSTNLNILNSTVLNSILSSDNNLKVNCEVRINPVAYLNIALKSNIKEQENLITKKCELSTSTISQFINTNFEHTINLETKNNITKILCHNSYFAPEKVVANDGFAVVEGVLHSHVVYESNSNENNSLLELFEKTKIKLDVETNGLSKDNTLDLTFAVDKSFDNITTETDEDNNVIVLKNKIQMCGVALKNITINVIDDAFSTTNEIEVNTSQREFTKNCEPLNLSEIVTNEMSLSNDEPAIDEVVANLNITPEITNTYIKDNKLFVEGLISSNLIYVDENKEIKNKQLEIPFVINTKQQLESLGCVHHEIDIVDTKVKVKRGTIIEVEYSLFMNLCIYENKTQSMVDNFTISKALDFSKYDFQIYLAKPKESLWDLCKRIKISPDEIHKHNKDLPLVMEGKEKIIIKR